MKKALIFIGLKLAEITAFVITNLLLVLLGKWNPIEIPITVNEIEQLPETFWQYLGVGWIYFILLLVAVFLIFLLYLWIDANSELADRLKNK